MAFVEEVRVNKFFLEAVCIGSEDDFLIGFGDQFSVL